MSSQAREVVARNVACEVSDADLDELARRLGHRLPAAYRRFVKTANGGTLDYVLPLECPWAEPVEICAGQVLRVDRASGFQALGIRSAWARNLGDPGGLVPFLHEGAGGVVFVDVSSDRGAVSAYFTEYARADPSWADLVPVAPTFEEGMAKLVPDIDALRLRLEDGDLDDEARLDEYLEYVERIVPGWRDNPALLAAVEYAREDLDYE